MIRTGAHFRILSAAAAALAVAWADPALAASTYTVTVTTPDLGTIISGASGDTVFRIDSNTGNVSVVSGTGVRSGVGSARALVTIKCTGSGGGNCNKDVNIRLGTIGSPIGRARTLSQIIFTMGTAVLTSTPGSPSSPTFSIGPIGLNSTKTFWVGGNMGIAGDDSGLPTGAAESDFFVWAAETPGTPTNGANGGFKSTVIRGLSIAKTADLEFGSVVKPSTGSGSVSIDATSGSRTTAGGVVGVASPTPARATFAVTGEGGQAISVTVPASFAMNGPAAITVTTTNSVSGSPVLSGALGSGGSFSFGVGGSAPIASTTPSGSYTGNFTVTVAYN